MWNSHSIDLTATEVHQSVVVHLSTCKFSHYEASQGNGRCCFLTNNDIKTLGACNRFYLFEFVLEFLWDIYVRDLCRKIGWKNRNNSLFYGSHVQLAHRFPQKFTSKWELHVISSRIWSTYCYKIPCAEKSVYLSWFCEQKCRGIIYTYVARLRLIPCK